MYVPGSPVQSVGDVLLHPATTIEAQAAADSSTPCRRVVTLIVDSIPLRPERSAAKVDDLVLISSVSSPGQTACPCLPTSAPPGPASPRGREEMGWARRAPWLLIVPDAPLILPDHFSAANIHDLLRRTCASLSQRTPGRAHARRMHRPARERKQPAVDGTRPPCAIGLLLCGNFQRSHHGRRHRAEARAATPRPGAAPSRGKPPARAGLRSCPPWRHLSARSGSGCSSPCGAAPAGHGHTGFVGCVGCVWSGIDLSLAMTTLSGHAGAPPWRIPITSRLQLFARRFSRPPHSRVLQGFWDFNERVAA